MATDLIRYDLLTQQALRDVVRRVLTDAAKKGLPGEHHFYISFATQAEGVKLSQRLRGQYPEEMTIIMQHQFWDLTVGDDRFEIGLSFNGIPERLTVPFAAIKGFFDPSVQFGLQFEDVSEAAALPGSVKANDSRPQADVSDKRRPAAPATVPTPIASPSVAQPTAAQNNTDDKPDDKPAGGGEVVRLDRFRKK